MDVLRRSEKIKYDHELIIPEESMPSITLKTTPSGIDDKIEANRSYIPSWADVYHSEHNKWYRIDDVTITELEDDDVLKGGEVSDLRTAYI
ncbi:CPS_collapsed_G0016940.mRNA.1.CDS.1 [Saccharomyces cerevisiae]|nr:CPS_collapsed_G0016940.mRNA.1.CDS.1 [Saccharomyces cerevisiae]